MPTRNSDLQPALHNAEIRELDRYTIKIGYPPTLVWTDGDLIRRRLPGSGLWCDVPADLVAQWFREGHPIADWLREKGVLTPWP